MAKVLVSPGFGAGWSSWEDVDPTDEGLVTLVEDGAPLATLKAYAQDKWPSAYLGGLEDGLEVEHVPEGELYQIREYDGAESLVVFNPDNWRVG